MARYIDTRDPRNRRGPNRSSRPNNGGLNRNGVIANRSITESDEPLQLEISDWLPEQKK